MRKFNYKRLLQVIGILLFIYLISLMDFSILWGHFSKINLPWLLLSILFLPGVYLLKALRWKLLLQRIGVNYAYKNALLAFTSSNFIAFITPGRLGELAKSFYVKADKGIAVAYTLPTVFLDRIFDMYTLLLFALWGILEYAIITEEQFFIFPIFLIIIISPLIFLNRRFLYLLARGTRKFPKVEQFILTFANGIGKFKLKDLIGAILLTFAAYIFLFLVAQSIGESLQLGFTIIEYAIIISIANILSFLPISIAGIGTREAAFIFLFALKNYAAEVAVLYSVLVFLIFFVVGGFLGYICFLIKPITLKSIKY